MEDEEKRPITSSRYDSQIDLLNSYMTTAPYDETTKYH